MVHFPVALFTTAFVCDLVLLLGFRRCWFDRCAVLLYFAAALMSASAAISGKLAANEFEILVEGLERQDINEATAAVALHGDWAFFAVVLLFLVAALRLEALWRDRAEAIPTVHRARVLAFAVAISSQWVIVHTAGRGGELVYRYGVGREDVVGQDRAIIPNGGESR